jgi:hypothetical protein
MGSLPGSFRPTKVGSAENNDYSSGILIPRAVHAALHDGPKP